jgi:aminoglycoside 3-N-acetyltransferase
MFNKLLSIHPFIEYFVRFINLKFTLLSTLNKKRFKKISSKKFYFDDLFTHLDSLGVDRNGILITHSSYENIKNCGLTPNQIIQKLLNYISPNGTLAMNATRNFRMDNDSFYTYDVYKSRVSSGVIPAMFLKFKDIEVSRFPINSIVAFGRQAKDMIKNNIENDFLSSCGDKSSWKYCMDNGAWILGLGIDLTHSLTIIHVLEESNHHLWPINEWFEVKNFKIIDNNPLKEIKIFDRKKIWGSLHFAERTLAKDLVENDIIKVFYLNGTRFELLNSKDLYEFLNKKNKKGYPYFFINKKYFKNGI